MHALELKVQGLSLHVAFYLMGLTMPSLSLHCWFAFTETRIKPRYHFPS